MKANVVSILVLMDLSFLLEDNTSIDETLDKFQSLFLWIFRSYIRKIAQCTL